jgi:putative tricarboxylic transport membrane protein
MSDRLLGGIVFVLALAFIAGATQIESAIVFDALGPKTFPIIIGVVLAIASLYPLLRPDPEPAWPAPARGREIVAALGVMVAYSRLLEPHGFVIATALAAAVLSWRLGASLAVAAGAGVGISIGIYVVFHLILGLSLARGPFGF